MRIIAGTARGRLIVAPKGMDTRPTLDHVRESLFNIIRPYLVDAEVLDLFAGSGALGLEALSCGAKGAVFVDHARAAGEAVRRNMETLGFGGKARFLSCDWQTALKKLGGKRFDLVFLDPPYRMREAKALLETLLAADVMARDGLVIYEHAKDFSPDAAGWVRVDERVYRDTVITFLKLPEGEEA